MGGDHGARLVTHDLEVLAQVVSPRPMDTLVSSQLTSAQAVGGHATNDAELSMAIGVESIGIEPGLSKGLERSYVEQPIESNPARGQQFGVAQALVRCEIFNPTSDAEIAVGMGNKMGPTFGWRERVVGR